MTNFLNFVFGASIWHIVAYFAIVLTATLLSYFLKAFREFVFNLSLGNVIAYMVIAVALTSGMTMRFSKATGTSVTKAEYDAKAAALTTAEAEVAKLKDLQSKLDTANAELAKLKKPAAAATPKTAADLLAEFKTAAEALKTSVAAEESTASDKVATAQKLRQDLDTILGTRPVSETEATKALETKLAAAVRELDYFKQREGLLVVAGNALVRIRNGKDVDENVKIHETATAQLNLLADNYKPTTAK